MSYRFTVFLVAALGVPLLLDPAMAEDWTVSKISGQAWVSAEGADRTLASAGMVVPAGSSVRTGAASRVMLVYGKDTVVLSPGTVVTIPLRADPGVAATIYEQVGSIDLTIEKRSAPHFSVQTAYLAAIVKGTIFKVSVDAKVANVSVTRGVVGVADLKSGQHADVRAGQKASAAAVGGGLSVSGIGSKPSVRPGTPQRAKVSVSRSGLSNPTHETLAQQVASPGAAGMSATSTASSSSLPTPTSSDDGKATPATNENPGANTTDESSSSSNGKGSSKHGDKGKSDTGTEPSGDVTGGSDITQGGKYNAKGHDKGKDVPGSDNSIDKGPAGKTAGDKSKPGKEKPGENGKNDAVPDGSAGKHNDDKGKSEKKDKSDSRSDESGKDKGKNKNSDEG